MPIRPDDLDILQAAYDAARSLAGQSITGLKGTLKGLGNIPPGLTQTLALLGACRVDELNALRNMNPRRKLLGVFRCTVQLHGCLTGQMSMFFLHTAVLRLPS